MATRAMVANAQKDASLAAGDRYVGEELMQKEMGAEAVDKFREEMEAK